MLRKTLLLIFILVIVAAAAFAALQRREPEVQASVLAGAPAADWAGFARATGTQPLTFPADYGPHPDYQTEWWYYTGNLDAADGRRFGFQFTIFRRALTPEGETTDYADSTDCDPGNLCESVESVVSSDWRSNQVYLAHFAISDIDADAFYPAGRFSRGAAGLAGATAEPYRVWLEDWSVEAIAPGQVRLRAQTADAALDPRLRSRAYAHSSLSGAANLLIMPNLDAANIAYNITRQMTDGVAIGPILMGISKPGHILTPASTVRRVVNMTALAAVEAQIRDKLSEG